MPDWLQNIIQKEIVAFRHCYQFIIQPRLEWNALNEKTPGISSLFKETLLIIAAVPAIARLLSWGIIDFSDALLNALLWYALMIGVVWGLAKVVGLIAPSFESNPDEDKTFALVFYSFLPFLVGGLLYMVPLLTLIVPILGLYGFYMLWLGVPVLLNTPDNHHIIFTVIIAALQIAAVLVVSRLTGGLVLSF